MRSSRVGAGGLVLREGDGDECFGDRPEPQEHRVVGGRPERVVEGDVGVVLDQRVGVTGQAVELGPGVPHAVEG